MAKRRGKKEGTLYQRANGRWRAQVCMDGSCASFTAESKAECHAWLREMLDQAGQLRSISSPISETSASKICALSASNGYTPRC